MGATILPPCSCPSCVLALALTHALMHALIHTPSWSRRLGGVQLLMPLLTAQIPQCHSNPSSTCSVVSSPPLFHTRAGAVLTWIHPHPHIGSPLTLTLTLTACLSPRSAPATSASPAAPHPRPHPHPHPKAQGLVWVYLHSSAQSTRMDTYTVCALCTTDRGSSPVMSCPFLSLRCFAYLTLP